MIAKINTNISKMPLKQLSLSDLRALKQELSERLETANNILFVEYRDELVEQSNLVKQEIETRIKLIFN